MTPTATVMTRGRRAAFGVAALVAASLAVNAAWIARHLDWLRPLEAGQPAPPFELPVLGDSGKPTGAHIDLASLRGKVVVLEFWATWCAPCRASLPHLDRMARNWGDGVVAIAVNLDDGPKARAIFAEEGWQLTLTGSDEELAMRYQVEMLPHLVVIDQAGVVRLVARGGKALPQVQGAVARLMKQISVLSPGRWPPPRHARTAARPSRPANPGFAAPSPRATPGG
jgi:thiol-disulfide isomerase/thioredoxin